uniref:Uncharacterized protein LOC114338282 n=1 Tax=Diabrotica virgifera virgifera TaxID=50390 RepID=A0A6P7G6J2_DIAVI
MRIHKTLIQPITCYSSEAWVLKETSKNKLDTFERTVLRRILGPVRENRIFRSRNNNEIYQLYNETPLSDFITIQRLQWAGHVIRMGEDRLPKRALNARMQGKDQLGSHESAGKIQ